MSTPRYPTFPGLWPYIERSAQGRHLPSLGRGRGLWHYKQVQDSLGQFSRLDEGARRELLAHVESVRDSLAAVVEGIDLAISEATRPVDENAAASPAVNAPAAPAGQPPCRATRARRRRDQD